MNILNHETVRELFNAFYPFFVTGLCLGAFAITYYLIPKVLWVSKEKKLTAPVNDRSAHVFETPSFGGVAFFITLILIISLLQSLRLNYVGNHIIAAITILFMVGLKDDLVVSTARIKLIGQITAACFLVFSPEMQLNSLHGFWGVYEIPEILGYSMNVFIVVALINAYNLIDGIDGLASMLGIVIAGVYAYIFFETGNSYFVLISVTIVGVLAAFLRFNFSRGERKIFMGDSGSLVIGLLLAFLTLKILVMEPHTGLMQEGHSPANRILLISMVLFLPVFDTLRVMLLRLIDKRSPFSADRNHIHHVLLDLGFSHFRASASLALLNLLVVAIYSYASTRLTNLWLSFGVVLIYALTFFIFSRLKIFTQNAARPTHSSPKIKGVNVGKRKQMKEEYSS